MLPKPPSPSIFLPSRREKRSPRLERKSIFALMLRAIPLLSALALLLSSPSQAALVSAAPAPLPPAMSENASTAFLIAHARWRYHHYDARGHCVLLTDSTGELVEQYEYDAFGKPYFYNGLGTALPNGSAVGNRFLFTGRKWLSDLKLYDYRHRMYQPELGRFLQPDPKQFAAGDYNLYRYCHNDPVNKTDPDGLAADTLADIVFIAYDLYKVFTDPSNRGEHLTALGLDTGAAFVPFATGAGVVYRAGKTAERAAEAATVVTKKPVVIGENMEERVIPTAEKIGGHYYKPKGEYTVGKNKKWAQDMKRQIDKGERKLKDIGPDPERKVRSEAYEVERKVFYDEKRD
jgi:RHS repeat-associated protein